MTDNIDRPVITLEAAQRVLWAFGDTNLGVEPGGFFSALHVAIQRADLENRARLAVAFPEDVAAVAAVKEQPWGLDWLRSIVKADLDGRERGLDFTPADAGMVGLIKGRQYVGAVTGMLRGERVTRDVTFTAARDQDPEPFIRDREDTPDQDRVFVVHPHGSAPHLFVAGSIRPVAVSA